jgi:NTP pyrophosphatase (non-canonical NTP hydrolase)
MTTILEAVAAERARQDAKWGVQRHPVTPRSLAGRDPERIADDLEVSTEERAKFLCEWAAKRGDISWGAILLEEVAEAVAAAARGDVDATRKELVQVAAVAVAIIESVDAVGLDGAKR